MNKREEIENNITRCDKLAASARNNAVRKHYETEAKRLRKLLRQLRWS